MMTMERPWEAIRLTSLVSHELSENGASIFYRLVPPDILSGGMGEIVGQDVHGK